REGFARENLNGIDLRAVNRNFRDDNHKPELVVALTKFVAMAGFRPLSQTLELFDALHCNSLEEYRDMINLSDEEDSVRSLFNCWIQLEPEARDSLIRSIVVSAHSYLVEGDNSQIKFILETILCLHKQYPHDAGVLISLLLNFYELSP